MLVCTGPGVAFYHAGANGYALYGMLAARVACVLVCLLVRRGFGRACRSVWSNDGVLKGDHGERRGGNLDNSATDVQVISWSWLRLCSVGVFLVGPWRTGSARALRRARRFCDFFAAVWWW